MYYVLLVGSGLLGLYFIRQWAARAGPARVCETLRWLAIIGGAIILLLLVARGGSAGLALLFFLLPLLLPLLQRWLRTAPAQPTHTHSGDHSEVTTQFLRMSLDHASGTMSGTVLSGQFTGRPLASLTLAESLALWRECQSDPQSVAVVEAYLDRTQGPAWREALQDAASPAPARAMDRSEAYAILGLAPGASRDEIKAAHRRLMQRLHPDHGGSDYLAARINEAKDLLMSITP
jgi:hypothetical protein